MLSRINIINRDASRSSVMIICTKRLDCNTAKLIFNLLLFIYAAIKVKRISSQKELICWGFKSLKSDRSKMTLEKYETSSGRVLDCSYMYSACLSLLLKTFLFFQSREHIRHVKSQPAKKGQVCSLLKSTPLYDSHTVKTKISVMQTNMSQDTHRVVEKILRRRRINESRQHSGVHNTIFTPTFLFTGKLQWAKLGKATTVHTIFCQEHMEAVKPI